MLIFLVGLPELRWFLGASIVLGLGAGVMRILLRRHVSFPRTILKLTQ